METLMAKKAVTSSKVAKTKGPYVQGVEVRDAKLVFTSGVIARDAAGSILGIGDIRAQTRQCFENIKNIIEAAGGTLADLVKVTVYIRPGEDYVGMNDVRRELLAGIDFASSTVQVGLNASDALIEIEAVAAVELGKA
jgi:2-iminobutanoate/2-iminopropanoate deaminase